MNTDRNRSVPLTRASRLAACLAALGGCASLDPAEDYRRAGGLVEERSGSRVDWTSPWSETLDEWDGSSPLTQDAAVRMSLLNNRQLRAEVERIAESRADLVQAGLLPNPVLSLTLRAPVDPADGVWFVGAAAVQQLTAIWLRDGKIRAADARLNETVLDVSDRALRLVADVRSTHARIAFGQKELELTREAEALVMESIDAMGRRVTGGEATSLDTARLEQQLVSFETEEADLARALAKERRRLLELMGFPAAEADWTASDANLVRALPADEATAIALARSQRLDVAASRALAEANAADLSVEERNRLKEFGVGVDFERDTDETYTLGPVIEAEIPIFDTNEAQIAKAGSMARAALATSEAVAHRAIREARAAYVEATEAAILAGRLRNVAVPLGERVAELAQRGVTAGVSDTTVLLEARRDLLEVRRTLTRREADAAVAAVELEYAVGGTVDAPSVSAGTVQKKERP